MVLSESAKLKKLAGFLVGLLLSLFILMSIMSCQASHTVTYKDRWANGNNWRDDYIMPGFDNVDNPM